MVFCNKDNKEVIIAKNISHNPYFNRWFSAIDIKQYDILNTKDCHNPYFNRWFSAMMKRTSKSVLQ